MNVMRKRLISLNLAILMLLSLVLPAGAAELGEPAVVLTAEQSETPTAEPAVQADDSAEGTVRIYLNGEFYGNAKPGETYVLPQLDGDGNNVLSGWNIYCDTQNGGYSLQAEQIDGRWQVVIPSSAQSLSLNPKYRFVGTAVVNGEPCDFSGSQQYFHGTGWHLQGMSNDGIKLFLDGYDGGAIDVPAKILAVYYSGNNIVKGDTDAPALYSAGDLYFYQQCEEGKHATLTVTAGSGQSAVSAKRLDPAPHLTLTGGEDATALASGTKLFSTGEYSLRDAEGNELTVDPTTVSYLKTEAVSLVAVINGNGGTADGGKTTLEVPYESCALPKIEGLFQWSGHAYDGWSASRRYDETGKLIGLTYTIRWIDTKLEHFISFQTVYPIQEKETLSYDEGNGSGYLFCDNSEGQVIAPTVTYTNANHGVLAYWQTQGSDSEAIHQYRPGDTVKESDGTEFYASTIQPDRQVLLIGNGKNFDSLGRSMRVSDRAYRLSAADGSQLLSWNTQADGKGTAYAPNTEIDLSGRTTPLVLYAQWLQKGEIKVTIDMGKGSCAKSAKPGTRYELPEIIPSTKDRAFDHWSAYYRTKDGEYPDLEVKQDANGNWYVDIPADAAGVTCSAYFLPTGTFNIGGVLCKFTKPDQVFKDENGKWTLHFEWRSNGCVVLRLYGYHGGLIKLPAEAAIEVYEDSTITATDKKQPALEAYSTLWLVTLCGEDKHPTLTVTGADGQSAIDAVEVTFNGPHIVVTTQGHKAVEGEVNWAGDLCALRGGTSADNARALKWKEAQAEDLTYLKTDPLFSDVTFRGNGGKATDGSEKETLVKTYENGIYAKNLDRLFKKDGALYAGYAVGGRRHEESTSIYIDGDGTVDILWAESEYPNFVAFHTEGVILEKLEETDYDFGWGAGYLFRDNSKTVIAPTITYQDPVSNGNLVYWYVSDDGEGSANAKQYLPGDVVKEESGTELYPAVVYANWNAAFMSNGKTFENGKLAIIAKQCPAEMKAADGTELIGWNTEKDGSGQAYELGSEPDLAGRTEPLVLYAQWKPVYVAKVEEPKPNEPQTGGTLTIKPRPTPAPDPGTGTDPEPTEPEKPAPIKKTQKVLVGVYRWGMMIAVLQGETDEKGEEIYCTVPKGLDLTGCALKLFVLSEAYAPDRKVEFILLSE